MTTHELNKDQIEQLKSNLFYNEDEWSNELTQEEIDTIENYTNWNEIPDEIVHKNYAGVDFVPDDFSKEENVKYPAITTVEDLCIAFGKSLEQQDDVQARLERVLEYLYENDIIDNYYTNEIRQLFARKK